jgi:hypothetical protein
MEEFLEDSNRRFSNSKNIFKRYITWEDIILFIRKTQNINIGNDYAYKRFNIVSDVNSYFYQNFKEKLETFSLSTDLDIHITYSEIMKFLFDRLKIFD